MSYSQFIYGLKLANIDLDRKVLSSIAMVDAQSFTTIAEAAKGKLAEAKAAA